jgi:hypothetical protein
MEELPVILPVGPLELDTAEAAAPTRKVGAVRFCATINGIGFHGSSVGPLLSRYFTSHHFFIRSNQFVVTVKGAVLPGP